MLVPMERVVQQVLLVHPERMAAPDLLAHKVLVVSPESWASPDPRAPAERLARTARTETLVLRDHVVSPVRTVSLAPLDRPVPSVRLATVVSLAQLDLPDSKECPALLDPLVRVERTETLAPLERLDHLANPAHAASAENPVVEEVLVQPAHPAPVVPVAPQVLMVHRVLLVRKVLPVEWARPVCRECLALRDLLVLVVLRVTVVIAVDVVPRELLARKVHGVLLAL